MRAWQHRALCAEVDPELWFPKPGAKATAAKRICAECPVRAECLGFALAERPEFGIWAGLNTDELRALAAELDMRRPCRRCGAPFHPRHSTNVYCTPECAATARHASVAAYEQQRRQARRAAA